MTADADSLIVGMCNNDGDPAIRLCVARFPRYPSEKADERISDRR
jgi:hypothetical protein